MACRRPNPFQNSILQDLIERNRTKGSDPKGSDLIASTYEAYGFGGAGLVCEALTDNINRAVSEFRDAVKKSGAKVAEQGSVMFNFERKGVVRVSRRDKGKGGISDEDFILNAAMESGAEDVAEALDDEDETSEDMNVVTRIEDWASVAAVRRRYS